MAGTIPEGWSKYCVKRQYFERFSSLRLPGLKHPKKDENLNGEGSNHRKIQIHVL